MRVLRAEANVVRQLRSDGRPLARVTNREVIADHDTRELDVKLTLEAGERVNLDGKLPTDVGVRGFLEVAQRARLGAVGLDASARFTVGSGRPRNVLVDSDDGLLYLLPRGAGGRGPMLAQADVRVAARVAGLTISLDVINLFDRRDATGVDEVYTNDNARPIPGGTTADLPRLATTSGTPATPRTAYLLPFAFTPPLSIALGVHKQF